MGNKKPLDAQADDREQLSLNYQPTTESPSLGVCFTALNEAPRIAAAIAQFYPYVEGIAVIVDDRTTDKTVEWAERMGATVKMHTWNDSWCKAKNASMDMLDTDWVYVSDCDELLEPSLLAMLPSLIAPSGQILLMREGALPSGGKFFDCYGLPRKNFIDGAQTDVYPDYQYRLLAKHVRYDPNGKQVHQEVMGFKERTEIDFKRCTLDNLSRFNILHYKSSTVDARQNALYDDLKKKGIDV